MNAESSNQASAVYLYACHDGGHDRSPSTVFYRLDDDTLSRSIIVLFEKEYGGAEGNPTFHQRSAADISDEEQVLLDEAIDELAIYGDPAPGVSDPSPSRQTILRVHYADRAKAWETILHSRRASPAPGEQGNAPGGNAGLSDELLLWICRVSPEDEHVTPELMDDLRLVASLIPDRPSHDSAKLQQAMALLASVLGQLAQPSPSELPFDDDRRTITPRQWIEREALEQAGKQIAGLIWDGTEPGAVAVHVCQAVLDAINLGFLEEQKYDAWRPGMASGPGWRSAVSATPYGIAKARASLGLKDASVSMGSAGLRAETTAEHAADADAGSDDRSSNPVRQLISALKELRLATGELLYESEKMDIYPESQVNAYHAAQREAEALVDGIAVHLAYGRENPGQIETEIREMLETLSRAMEHVASENNDYSGAFPLARDITGPAWEALKGLKPIEIPLAQTTLKPKKAQMPVGDPFGAAGSNEAGAESVADGDVQAGEMNGRRVVENGSPVTTRSSTPSNDDRYEWARQAELVRAINQVVGAGRLNKGVLSKACTIRHVETNGESGRKSLVKVSSFLKWVSRKLDLAREEEIQVDNAIVGEIKRRNS